MRKTLSVSVFLAVMACGAVLAYAKGQEVSGGIAETGADVRMQQLVQEAQRTKELLEIWKDHVRALTEERDQANEELERVRNGAVPPAPAPEPSGDLGTAALQAMVGDLKNQIVSLREENQSLKRNEKELEETRADRDTIVRSKEQALAQLETLKNANAKLQKEIGLLKVQNTGVGPVKTTIPAVLVSDETLQNEIQKLKAEKELLQRRYQLLDDNFKLTQSQLKNITKKKEGVPAAPAREVPVKIAGPSFEEQALRKENLQFKSTVTELNAKIKALEDTDSNRASLAQTELLALKKKANEKTKEFEALVSELQGQGEKAGFLQSELQKISEENLAMKNRIEASQNTVDSLRSQLQNSKAAAAQSEKNIVDLNTQLSALKTDKVESKERLEGLKAQLALLKQENQKIKALSLELETAKADKQSVQDSYAQLTRNFDNQSSKLNELLSRIEGLESSSQALRSQKTVLEETTADLRSRAQKFQSDRDAAVTEKEELRKSNSSLSQAFQTERSEREKAQVLLKAMDAGLQEKDAKLRELQTSAAELQKANQALKAEFKNTQASQAKVIENLRGNLQSNLADIQNLKTNFESYLESLVATFDERRK